MYIIRDTDDVNHGIKTELAFYKNSEGNSVGDCSYIFFRKLKGDSDNRLNMLFPVFVDLLDNDIYFIKNEFSKS